MTQLGTPTKLTPELIQKLCAYIDRGVAMTLAAPACGITPRTFNRWMEHGERDAEAGVDSIWASFYLTISVQRAKKVQACMDRIDAAAEHGDNWTANTWILERLYQRHYSKDVDLADFMQKQFDELKAQILKQNETKPQDLGLPAPESD